MLRVELQPTCSARMVTPVHRIPHLCLPSKIAHPCRFGLQVFPLSDNSSVES